jgi:hypothetical protein
MIKLIETPVWCIENFVDKESAKNLCHRRAKMGLLDVLDVVFSVVEGASKGGSSSYSSLPDLPDSSPRKQAGKWYTVPGPGCHKHDGYGRLTARTSKKWDK